MRHRCSLTLEPWRLADAAQQLEHGVQRDHLGRDRYAGQAEPGRQRAAGHHALAEPEVLRPQPDAVAEGGGVLQRTLQHLGVDDRHVGLAEGDAAGLGQLDHLGQHLALQAARERAEREHARLVALLGAELEHLHQAGLVEHRLCVGRADQAGDAAGDGRGQLAGQHAGMLLAGLAQPHRQVDQPGGTMQPLASMHTVGAEIGRYLADADDLAGRNRDVGHAVGLGGGVDQTTVLDQDLHLQSLFFWLRPCCRRRCPSPPCAPRCRRSPAAAPRSARRRPRWSRSRLRG
jgi:hypothetical protein